MMKSMFLIYILLISANVFSQKLTEQQKHNIDTKVAKMTEVMKLDETQAEMMERVQMNFTFANEQISKSTKSGTKENKTAMKACLKLHDAMAKNIVNNEQWKKWKDHSKEQRKAELAQKAEESKLSEETLAAINQEVEKMKEILKLTEAQKIEIRRIKINYALAQQIMYNTLEKGESRNQLFLALKKYTHIKLCAVTSEEQMNRWNDMKSKEVSI